MTSSGLLAALLVLAAGGCTKETEPISLQRLVEKAIPRPPKEHVEMMFDPHDADRRRQGIEGLSKRSWGLKEPYLKAYATAAKTDRDPLVRSAALRALGRSGDAKYLLVIVEALKDEETSVRWDAAIALDNVPGEAAIDPLRKAGVSDPSVDVRIAAIQALRHYKHPRVVTTLVRCLSDEEFTARHRAHEVLVKLVGRDHGYDPAGWIAGGAEPPGRDESPTPAKTKKPWWRIFSWAGRDETKEAPRARDQAGTPPEKPLKPTRRVKPWWRSPGDERAKPRAPDQSAPPWWDWLDLTSGRGKAAKEPGSAPAKPAAQASRPWWDWLGVTSRRPEPAKGAAKPEPAPPAGRPPAPAKPRRPWWDWLGVTARRRPSAQAAEPAPERRPAPRGEDAARWDLLQSGGRTGRSPAAKQPAAPAAKPGASGSSKPAASAGSGRPWWDWFGITKKKSKPSDR